MTAEDFNNENPVGALFHYYPIQGQPEYEPVNTRSLAWELGGGETVVKVTGRTGGVAVSHLSPPHPLQSKTMARSNLTITMLDGQDRITFDQNENIKMTADTTGDKDSPYRVSMTITGPMTIQVNDITLAEAHALTESPESIARMVFGLPTTEDANG